MTSSTLTDHVQAYCTKGHAQTLWGQPLMAKRGERVRFWGSPFTCGKCGSAVYGGRRAG